MTLCGQATQYQQHLASAHYAGAVRNQKERK